MSQPDITRPADISAVEDEHEFMAQAGPLAPVAGDDGRRFPRFHFRSCIDALVHPPANNPDGEPLHCQMLTRDISRGGMNVLHKSQLFPGQLIDVILHDGQRRRLEVMWCRRLGAGCFTAGCRFVRLDDDKVGPDLEVRGEPKE